MISSILAIGGIPGGWELIIIFIVGLIFYGIPIVLIVMFVKHVVRTDKEMRRLRLEVGKLADELEQVRKKGTGTEKGNSSEKSG
jgi:hypothetical protein